MDGLGVKLLILPTGGTGEQSATSLCCILYTGVEGLTVGYAANGEDGNLLLLIKNIQ